MMRIQLCRGWEMIGTTSAYAFNGVIRDTQPGEWGLSSPETALTMGYSQSLLRIWTPEDVDGVRVVERGVIRFAGLVRVVSDGVGGRELRVDSSGARWAWSGPDLWGLLSARLVFPDPTLASGWSVAYNERTAAAAAVIGQFVSYNLGADALDARDASVAVITDGSGTSAMRSGRLQPLSDLVVQQCRDAGLVCRLSVNFDGDVSVRVEQPRDLSGRLIFTDSDVTEATVRYLPPTATWTLAGGTGAGASRVFRSADTSATGLDRIEQFLDLSSVTSADQLQEAATANNRLGVEQWQVSATPTDAAADRWRHGVDFNVGDTVGVDLRGNRYQMPVSAVSFDLSAARQVVRPVLGTAAPDALSGLQRDVANLAARFDSNIT